MFVRMTQAYVGALRKVGYRAPQPKSPISIRIGIRDYVSPGSVANFLIIHSRLALGSRRFDCELGAAVEH